MTLIIGLTGSIASGKSTVSAMFDTFHIPVIDADKLARKVVEPGEQAYNEIIHAFGDHILNDDQTLDRKKLGTIIFADEEKRKQLNSIVHPAVRKEMLWEKEAYINAGEKCVILDIPLLFESKLTDFVDKIVVVYVDKIVQLKRLMARDQSTEKEARQRIDTQIPLQEKAKLADAVIDNNGTKDVTYKQLVELLRAWQAI